MVSLVVAQRSVRRVEGIVPVGGKTGQSRPATRPDLARQRTGGARAGHRPWRRSPHGTGFRLHRPTGEVALIYVVSRNRLLIPGSTAPGDDHVAVVMVAARSFDPRSGTSL